MLVTDANSNRGWWDTLVTHANSNGFALTSLSGVRSGFMPPQLKTKQKDFAHILFKFFQFFTGSAAFMFYLTLRFRILRSSYFDIPVEFGMQLNIRPHWLGSHLICSESEFLSQCASHFWKIMHPSVCLKNVNHILEEFCTHLLFLRTWVILW